MTLENRVRAREEMIRTLNRLGVQWPLELSNRDPKVEILQVPNKYTEEAIRNEDMKR